MYAIIFRMIFSLPMCGYVSWYDWHWIAVWATHVAFIWVLFHNNSMTPMLLKCYMFLKSLKHFNLVQCQSYVLSKTLVTLDTSLFNLELYSIPLDKNKIEVMSHIEPTRGSPYLVLKREPWGFYYEHIEDVFREISSAMYMRHKILFMTHLLFLYILLLCLFVVLWTINHFWIWIDNILEYTGNQADFVLQSIKDFLWW